MRIEIGCRDAHRRRSRADARCRSRCVLQFHKHGGRGDQRRRPGTLYGAIRRYTVVNDADVSADDICNHEIAGGSVGQSGAVVDA